MCPSPESPAQSNIALRLRRSKNATCVVQSVSIHNRVIASTEKSLTIRTRVNLSQNGQKESVEQARHRLFARGAADRFADQGRDREHPDVARDAARPGWPE